MAVIFTSPKKSSRFTGLKYSIDSHVISAEITKLDFFILNGINTNIPFTSNSLSEFRNAVSERFKEQWRYIIPFLVGLHVNQNYILICSCPYSPVAQTQVKETGKFICHSGLIALMIQKYRPDMKIVLDLDREQRLIAGVRPLNSKCELCGLYETGKGCTFPIDNCSGPYRVTDKVVETNDIRYRKILNQINNTEKRIVTS